MSERCTGGLHRHGLPNKARRQDKSAVRGHAGSPEKTPSSHSLRRAVRAVVSARDLWLRVSAASSTSICGQNNRWGRRRLPVNDTKQIKHTEGGAMEGIVASTAGCFLHAVAHGCRPTWLPASLRRRSLRLFSLRMCDSSLVCASGMCCATSSNPHRLASFSTIQRTCGHG